MGLIRCLLGLPLTSTSSFLLLDDMVLVVGVEVVYCEGVS